MAQAPGSGPEWSTRKTHLPFVPEGGRGSYMTKGSAPEELAKAMRKIMAGGDTSVPLWPKSWPWG